MSEKATLAVIGGSGLYDMPGLQNKQEYDVTTPFGKPSSPIIVGELEGPANCLSGSAWHWSFYYAQRSQLPRQHLCTQGTWAQSAWSVFRLSARCAKTMRPVISSSQIIFMTTPRDRNYTFFGDGLVVHASVADPFCPDLSAQVEAATRETGATVHTGGSLITIEGPRFSTKAESHTFRSWGMSLIGMTASPEAFLAREAELCYATMAHVTDYDVWHVSESPVTVELVIETLNKNALAAQEAIRNLTRNFSKEHKCECDQALSGALITRKELIPPATREKVDLLIRKYY